MHLGTRRSTLARDDLARAVVFLPLRLADGRPIVDRSKRAVRGPEGDSPRLWADASARVLQADWPVIASLVFRAFTKYFAEEVLLVPGARALGCALAGALKAEGAPDAGWDAARACWARWGAAEVEVLAGSPYRDRRAGVEFDRSLRGRVEAEET